MSTARKSLHLILAAVVTATLSLPLPAKSPATAGNANQPQANQSQSSPALSFNGAHYLHRWSKGTQHEFTPAGQEDLSKWQDMITVVPTRDARDSTTLAALAEGALSQYKAAGKIIKTASTPPTQDKPAEYLLVALLPGKGFFETAFVRFTLIDGTGTMVVYAHRNYGESAADDFGAWMAANGTSIEQALMRWDGIPGPARLNALPQSP